jgi:hypothetical protein
MLEASKPEQILRRLDAYAELVAVVGAGIVEPMHQRPDRRAQDQPLLGDLPRPLTFRLTAVHGVLFHARNRIRGIMPCPLTEVRNVGVTGPKAQPARDR